MQESEFRAKIVARLRKEGWRVLIIGSGFSACRKCGSRYMGGSGSSPGVPDLSIRRQWWPQGTSLLVELKTNTGQLKKAQKALTEEGGSVILRPQDEPEFMEALDEYDKLFGGAGEAIETLPPDDLSAAMLRYTLPGGSEDTQ